MYADRTVPSSGGKKPIRDRLGGGLHHVSPSSLDCQDAPKRRREDNVRWNESSAGANTKVVKGDVSEGSKTAALQKNVLKSSKNGVVSTAQVHAKVLGMVKPQLVEVNRGAKESNVRSDAERTVTNKPVVSTLSAATNIVKKETVVEDSVEAFLKRLDLIKYHINFLAEEVDMFALKHMDDNDLKTIGLPMGPRKKILFSLATAKSRK